MEGFKRRLSQSLQLRLSVALSVAILLVATLSGAFSYFSAYDEALELQDNSLRQVAALYMRQGLAFHYPASLQPAAGDDEETRIVIQYLSDGLAVSHVDDSQLPLPLPGAVADGLSTVTVGNEPFRVLVSKDQSGKRFAVAQEIDSRNRDARESAWRALLPFAMLFPILLLVVSNLIRELFRPVGALATMLDTRDEQDLRPIDERMLANEIRPFVQAINRLLARVARTLESQKRFVADAAHELRTPLTALSLQAEGLEPETLSPRAQAQVAQLRLGIGRSRKLIEQLLALASAQLGDMPPGAVSVHEACRLVLEDLLPLAEQKQIDIGLEGEDVYLPMREIELRAVIKNLVENAIRHTPVAGHVDLHVEQGAGQVMLCVRDDGPGIAPAEWGRVFDPFYRGVDTTEEGAGLGLSIVQTIVQRSGGEVKVGYTDEASRKGWRVCLHWACNSN
ncbi:two-component sensor histidine kinase [Pseudomonas putida]|uniref:histidine kinase n=1 Tax=Pseudomonas putida TaxID=303 RepID=A0AA37R8C0_PSEPU|nr:ATP-binding protein [Pseudomonas putida]GLO15172.1 two-component sensor histidine kinase [Pseudomonas putida]GLO37317.1 two-component sensor histidine kinase [Pseudomonas putida]HDS0964590.1 HAMP domain-containing histidine kinase [Pseudomonas putida]HDS0990660.1 HAMP domain-containing histidine kinase [Pseudomonas putida]